MATYEYATILLKNSSDPGGVEPTFVGSTELSAGERNALKDMTAGRALNTLGALGWRPLSFEAGEEPESNISPLGGRVVTWHLIRSSDDRPKPPEEGRRGLLV